MDPIIITEGQLLDIQIDGHIISLIHMVDGGGEHALQLGGVNCNLTGEEPGLYYPEALQPQVA